MLKALLEKVVGQVISVGGGKYKKEMQAQGRKKYSNRPEEYL